MHAVLKTDPVLRAQRGRALAATMQSERKLALTPASPPGRGRSFRESIDTHRTVALHGAAKWSSLSPGERAGVRADFFSNCMVTA